MIDIYGVSLSRLPSKEGLIERLDSVLYESWLARHHGLRNEHASRASLAALLLLQTAGFCQRLIYDKMGRPSLTDTAVDFNITHTDGYTFCAVETPDAFHATEGGIATSPVCRVGLDAEDLSRLDHTRVAPLVSRWFSEKEEEFFLSSPSDETFLRIWTKKEALVKWLGTGLRDLRQADTVTAEAKCGVRFYEYCAKGAILSLCCRENAEPPSDIHWLTDSELGVTCV